MSQFQRKIWKSLCSGCWRKNEQETSNNWNLLPRPILSSVFGRLDVFFAGRNIQSFEDFMWEIEDEDKREGLFKYAARCAAYDWDFAEGLGYIGEAYMREFMANPVSYIVVSEKYDDCEEEIVRSREVVETHGGLN